MRTYKGVLSALFWLIRISQIHKFQNIAAQDAHWYVLLARYARIHTYGVGFSVVCSELKAMREP